ncbi:hypothetical protein B0H16DRAFT_1347701, partial [Mycena metata]
LVRFKSRAGKIDRAQNRFFTMIVSTSMRFIWTLRNERLFQTHSPVSEVELHNRWVSVINATLKRDQLRTNQSRFGSLAIRKQLVLNTWSGALRDEDSLWTTLKGVLVVIWPAIRKNRVG